MHVRGQAVPVPLPIHPGEAAGNHSGILKSLHAQVGTGPRDVQASRQCPDGNAPSCRDVGQARELGFPVFARAQVPVTARGRLRQKSAGEPILVGDVTVRPGDVVMADEGGVVVVPRERAAEVLDAAQRLAGRETAIEAEVRAGVPLPQAMRDARLAGTETT